MRRCFVSFILLSGCARTVVPDDVSSADTLLVFDAARDAPYDAAPADDTCLHYARPTGTCSVPGTCCVSSTCVMGICR